MKNGIIVLIFILVRTTAYSYNGQGFKSTSPYLNSTYQNNRTYDPITPRIGYTTTYNVYYSNGQYHSKSYKGITYGNILQNYRDQHYGRVGSQPRHITVYNGDGGTKETPGGRWDSKDWLYQFDGKDWWCSKDGGQTWRKWDSMWGWGLIGFDWQEGRGDPTEDAIHYHNDPNNQWVTPVGDPPIIPLIILLLCYIGYDIFNNHIKKT